MKSTTAVSKINPNAAAKVHLMSEQASAIKMSTVDIVERFSTNDTYDNWEQVTIDKAIDILAHKMAMLDHAQEFTSSQITKQFLQLKIGTSDREIFAVVFLNSQHRVIKYEEMFIGTIDAASVYPREIVRRALSLNAAAIIVAHNHPSGKLEASMDADRITDKIYQATKLVDIKLLDHVIVGMAGSMSYAETGKMPS